ncbi:MAG: hypothetical protein RLN72_12695 [Henriciella sp.]
MSDEIYSRFIGHWELDPASCDYKQGDPPRAGSYIIYVEGSELVFDMAWTDLAGNAHEASFRGIPDGEARTFNGGDLVDSLTITAENRSELNSSAAMKGETLMHATRTLIDDDTMRIVQTVYLPDGTAPSNKSVYYRRKPS